MKFESTILPLAVIAVALFGAVSPANASGVSQEQSHSSAASGAHLSLDRTYTVKDAGGTLAGTGVVEKVAVSGGTLADCGAAICAGQGSSSDFISGNSGSEYVVVSGGTLAAAGSSSAR